MKRRWIEALERDDWPQALRSFRTMASVNQVSLADMLGVSQAYVSRLEAGQVDPPEDIRLRIRRVLQDPAYQSVLDFVLTGVRRSPQIICVLALDGDRLVYRALSEGFRAHPQFQSLSENEPVEAGFVIDGEILTSDLLASGAFSGDLETMDAIWRAQREGVERAWRAINTPIRAENGLWLLHCQMSELPLDEYERLSKRRAPIILTPYN
ncbi:helix-turn-helix domain-containing protein [Maricaulis sp. D1M11]|uniref:helix-turn-helix domain-containing protein n=1 Tax=Maricaulis sp. D1M11 TaxID=3076117 RepID=UPI0039B5DE00